VEGAQLPPTASVAEQQAAYLTHCFNQHYCAFDPSTDADLPPPGPVRPAASPVSLAFFLDYLFTPTPAFRYVERGSLASLGSRAGVMDGSKSELGLPSVTGWAAIVAWRGAHSP